MCNNNTVHGSPLLLTILSIAVQSFVGVIFWRLFNPVAWVTPQGLSNCPPFFLGKHILVLWLLILVSWLILVFHLLEWRVWSHPSMGGKGPSSGGWEYSASGRETGIVIPPDMGYLCIQPPLFGLANHDPVQWVVIFILGFTIHQHQWALTLFPLPHVRVPSEVHGHIMLPKVFTHLWWMLQWMSTADVLTSR